jgi:hypothetical protein
MMVYLRPELLYFLAGFTGRGHAITSQGEILFSSIAQEGGGQKMIETGG